MAVRRILLVDNRDSFTWNLAHDLGRCGVDVEVRQAAECAVEDADGCDGVVLSPGPGLPSESVGLMALVHHWAPHRPMLGVCLGLQALVEWSGGRLRRLDTVRHGLSSTAVCSGHDPLFEGLSNRFTVGHYHSWCADRVHLPDCWEMTSHAEDDPEIPLSLRHRTLPLHAVQFHPESVLTPDGRKMLASWLGTLGK